MFKVGLYGFKYGFKCVFFHSPAYYSVLTIIIKVCIVFLLLSLSHV